MKTTTSNNKELAAENKLPLLIIYTGGTIGMQNSSDGYQPSADIQTLIENTLSQSALAQIKPYRVIEFEKLIDSANATPQDWLAIASCIQKNYQQYCAFLVLHGTDTMAYTSAALHHIFSDNCKPIIVTGSQIPMCEARSDAGANLLDAALFARSQQVSQVCICFAGKLLAGNSVKKIHTSHLSAFASLNRPPLATADIALNFLTSHAKNTTTSYLSTSSLPTTQQRFISVLLLYPGISDNIILAAFAKPATAVVMLSYGAGNPPDKNTTLISALKRAQENSITVINMSQCHQGAVAQGTYAVGSILNTLGVISAQDRTLEDVVTELYLNPDKLNTDSNLANR